VLELPHLVAHSASRAAAVDRMVLLLKTRCVDDVRGPLLRAAAEKWLANGGTLTDPLLPLPDPADVGGPALVPAHRLLEPGFRLEARAFMLTYNSASFTVATWLLFLPFIRGLAQRLVARAWACRTVGMGFACARFPALLFVSH